MSLRDDLVLQAQLYADRASVAQGTEQPPSKREDAGSTPVGGVIGTRLHEALEGLAGADYRMTTRRLLGARCVHLFPLGLHCRETG